MEEAQSFGHTLTRNLVVNFRRCRDVGTVQVSLASKNAALAVPKGVVVLGFPEAAVVGCQDQISRLVIGPLEGIRPFVCVQDVPKAFKRQGSVACDMW